MKKSILSCISLILVMLVTGVFWGTWFTLTRSLDTFPPDNFIRIGQTIIANVAWPMRILVPTTLLCLLWLSVITRKYKPQFYFFLCSFILLVVTLVITVGILVPIDNEINTWTLNNPPAVWEALRVKWGQFHTIRTFTSVLSFMCLSVGVVLDGGHHQ